MSAEAKTFTPAEKFRAQALGVWPDMLLPAGKTCEDCQTRDICRHLLGVSWDPDGRACDFSPSRFIDQWKHRGEAATDATRMHTNGGE